MATSKPKPTDMPGVQRHDSPAIVLPQAMGLTTAAAWLMKAAAAAEAVIDMSETFAAFPWEGALAVAAVLQARYGFTQRKGARMITVATSPTATTAVPWFNSPSSHITVPGIEGSLWYGTGADDDNIPTFTLYARTCEKHRGELTALGAAIRDYLRTNSLYRGAAIKLDFPDPDDPFENMRPPTFLDVESVNASDLVLPDATARLVDYSLFTPLRYPDACRRAGVPLKRGILLAGPYGCGKTLTANVAAQLATRAGWTFLYLKSASDLAAALLFAKRYQPAVIFAEDMDSVPRNGELQNVLDGIDTKRDEVIVVLTTNHPESIPPVLLRPGRLDAVISVGPPDAQAVQRLLRLYGRGLVNPAANLAGVAAKLTGYLPAVVRECVERAKLAVVSRSHGDGSRLMLESPDLELAADSMVHHLSLLIPRPADARSDVEKAADSIAASLDRAAVLADLRVTGPNGGERTKVRQLTLPMQPNGGTHPVSATSRP